MIERAGLVDLFSGKDSAYPEITFLGPTNHSIRRWMLDNRFSSLQEVTPEQCRELLLRHVIKGKYMRNDIPRGTQLSNQQQGEGGLVFKSIGGANLWLYTFQEAYSDIPGTGPVYIYMFSLDYSRNINIVSADIEPDNGVVHSLGYDFKLGQL